MDHQSFAGSAGDKGHKIDRNPPQIKLPSNCTPEIANYYDIDIYIKQTQ